MLAVCRGQQAPRREYQITFGFDGHISEVLLEPKKDGLYIGYSPFYADRPQNVRQIIRLKDKDHFDWTVTLKMGERVEAADSRHLGAQGCGGKVIISSWGKKRCQDPFSLDGGAGAG